jgi:hypothetical protein
MFNLNRLYSVVFISALMLVSGVSKGFTDSFFPDDGDKIGGYVKSLDEELKPQVNPKSIFPTIQSFSIWLHRHASFECPNDLNSAGPMVGALTEILYYGLQNIENLNPNLLINKIKASADRKVLITCVPTDKNRVWGGLYDPTSIFLDKTALRFSKSGNLILIPVDTIQLLVSQSQNQEFPPTKLFSVNWDVQAYRDPALYDKGAILHEFLHFLRFDNTPVEAHNSANEKNPKVRMDDDLVYSCAEMSYPFWSLKSRHHTATPSIRKSCYLCAMAEFKNGKVRVSEARASAANDVCAPLRKFER